MAARLRCLFLDPDAVDTGSRLGERALEACARAGIEVVEAADAEAVASAVQERMLEPEQCLAVGAALRDAPVGALWVGPLDLDVRGAHVRMGEEGEDLLYEAVITELAERR
jgi:hypothetical protein